MLLPIRHGAVLRSFHSLALNDGVRPRRHGIISKFFLEENMEDAGTLINGMLSIKNLWAAIVYSLLGIIVLALSFFAFDRLTPGNLWVEIVQNKNVALAVTAGAMILAMAQIIAAAIQG